MMYRQTKHAANTPTTVAPKWSFHSAEALWHTSTRTIDFVMNNRNEGLYIPPMVWCSFSDFSTDCVCLCLTSDEYDKEGYINDLNLYLNEIQK